KYLSSNDDEPSSELKNLEKKDKKKQETNSLHKNVKRKFKTNKTISRGIDDIWQADLGDILNISKYNSGYKFLLTCIDIFSKYAWVISLKNKSSEEVEKAFSKIFKERHPQKLNTDKRKEFLNTKRQAFFDKNKIKWYTTNSDYKASVVERFNRTLKQKMWGYFTHFTTYTYIDI
ncbi:unnamed protein product, partial [Brachionus calyciflorus]